MKIKLFLSSFLIFCFAFSLLWFKSNQSDQRKIASLDYCDRYSVPKKDVLCKLEIKDIYPTQFAVGMISVEAKAKKLNKMDDGELKKYLKEHPVPVVVGLGKLYIIDHHHLSRALSLLKNRQTHLYATIVHNFGALPEDKFWNNLISKKFVYLYDENGKGPLSPRSLPDDIMKLQDDPFRSLAWAVREEGGYNKVDIPFTEFAWANYFRSKFGKEFVRQNFDKATKMAIKLAKKDEARDLPGFIGK